MSTTQREIGKSQATGQVGLKKNTAIKEMTIGAMFISLTLVFTAFLNIQLPATMGGLIHLGNIPMFIAAMLFGKKQGAIAGGVGMALFDLLSGWTLYAPCTLVVVGVMGYVVGLICTKANNQKTSKRMAIRMIAMLVACVIKVAGYYVYEVFLYKSFVVPVASIPGNIMQILIAAVIVMLIIEPLNKQIRRG